MRKFIFTFFIIAGVSAGVLAAQNESLGLAVVLGTIGAVTGVAIGAAISGLGKSRRRSYVADHDAFLEMSDERSRNFWLDRGRLSDAPGLPHADDLDPHSLEP